MNRVAPTFSTDSPEGLGRLGIGIIDLRFIDPGEAMEAVAELEELGFGAAWVPGGIDGYVLSDLENFLSATRRMTLATGILNIFRHEPADVGRWWSERGADERARLMLGLGVSHGPLIGEAYGNPLAAMTEFLDGLDRAGVPQERVCLGALRPKMTELARRRTAGIHPTFTTPRHTAWAREQLGPDALLAPKLAVIIDGNPQSAREIARQSLTVYMQLPNYLNGWRFLGFDDDDVKGSDRLVDALFAWGSIDRVAERVREHHAAGANHVCLQVWQAPGSPVPRQTWRELAQLL